MTEPTCSAGVQQIELDRTSRQPRSALPNGTTPSRAGSDQIRSVAALVTLALLTFVLLWIGPELIKHPFPTSATTRIAETTITAYEPLATNYFGDGLQRKATVVLLHAGKEHTARFSSTGDLMPTPNVGVYVDGRGSIILSGVWESYRLDKDGGGIAQLPRLVSGADPRATTPGIVDREIVALQQATAANPPLCSPMALTPSLYIPGACYVGSFNFDGATRFRNGAYWHSSKWHFATAAERPEFFEDTTP